MVPGFLADSEELEVLGTVEASPKDQSFLIENNRVYMRLADPDVYDCGEVVTIVRQVKKKVRHPDSFFKKYGSLYQVLGEVRILHTYGNYVVVKFALLYKRFIAMTWSFLRDPQLFNWR